jgi:hypothetical protein
MTQPRTAANVPRHVQWIVDTGRRCKTSCGKVVEIWELRHTADASVLSAWAAHFRRQYCLDEHLDVLRAGPNLSRAEFLKQIKFPDASQAPGPSIRSGDFAEILAADYLEFVLNHWVPRTRYFDKTIRNESTKGSDVIGFKVTRTKRSSPTDTMVIIESKAKLTGDTPNGRLQAAITDSVKDLRRKAESLNAIKQRLLMQGNITDAQRIDRFQNPVDHPYSEKYGAVAVLATPLLDVAEIAQATTAAHPHANALFLIVIHGNELMQLAHTLYDRAANEA